MYITLGIGRLGKELKLAGRSRRWQWSITETAAASLESVWMCPVPAAPAALVNHEICAVRRVDEIRATVRAVVIGQLAILYLHDTSIQRFLGLG